MKLNDEHREVYYEILSDWKIFKINYLIKKKRKYSDSFTVYISKSPGHYFQNMHVLKVIRLNQKLNKLEYIKKGFFATGNYHKLKASFTLIYNPYCKVSAIRNKQTKTTIWTKLQTTLKNSWKEGKEPY